MDQWAIDDTDFRILQILISDSTLTHKAIGQQVHMTGQAVGARIRKMQETQVIEGFSVRWNPERIGLHIQAFVTVFLSSSAAHPTFQKFAKTSSQIYELHRVSGEGCYWMRIRVENHEQLNAFLDNLLMYGNYKVALSTERVK
ncbi:Lrp/AsnC family transcriptional regulator [Paenibacillus wynnii]|uniref:Transcriptional regulator n=1 Tax=Paenibacillus wynnii TaxID=268407 RepID=A0A098MAI7_9BACL|nr:Lrp/AsnC family transcriptional regulator [Paenibacillus wynnii]KGE19071.1 transcriptional regulator [Paenibacillus wynnii]